MQHYSFAVEAFIELGKRFSMNEYELAVHETKTSEVIENVKNHKSEIGILYINDFNEKALMKIFAESDLEFVSLFECGVCVYMAATHPLANKKEIVIEELSDYPCLSFEQGEKNSFYFAEEVLSTLEYRQIIKADDRATMLNLMTGMNGYTLCSGIIYGDLNGGNYVSIRYDNGMESFYCHLQSSTVKVGQRVECGQQVALSDNTGAYTTGAHLHMGIKKDGQYVDPKQYLNLPSAR